MKLSVIIVNYNVKYFLEQCLHSVRKAMAGIEGEIFVVDNNSVDGSLEMVKEKFPEAKVIANKKNLGFSRANNQALRAAKGEYALLLNPDTVVEEDTFTKVIRFMHEHPDAGGLGVKMLDGKGSFLPESKRGLPTPSVAFYKIFGLSRLFPRSRRFGKYHLGYLDKDQTHEVDVLSGAFMLLRKSALDKVGLLDEDFFMYGEDIDMSYRITKGGYRNYYYPGTRIIHYKGESTKKSSVNYVFVFYNAMTIFARKHFSQSNAKTFSFLINLAIYLRAGAAILARFFKAMVLPLTDAALIFAGLFVIKNYYEQIHFEGNGSYPLFFILYVVPSYIFLWLFTTFLSGGYDRPTRLPKIIRGIAVGTAGILVIYALLPETLRFSRLLILLGAAWSAVAMITLRMLLHVLNVRGYRLDSAANKRIAIAGSEEECERVNALLKQTSLKISFAGFVSVNESKERGKENHLGTLSQLPDIISIYRIDEVIFCAKDIPAQLIIDNMLLPGERSVDYKIAPPESLSVIGSNSIDTSGDLYTIDINSISKPANKRNKRLVDLAASFGLLISLPFTVFLVKNPGRFVKNIFRVIFGFRTWVGYNEGQESRIKNQKLPAIKIGVLFPTDILKNKTVTSETAERLNILYAKDYRAWNDLNIIVKGLRNAGR
ncbi:MAG TPA: glycosyltransferase [Bacteroidia bacterium]|jgi:GT2 family glycosyltransferase